MDRQKQIGWILVGGALAYLVWFLKLRLFMPGDPITRKEWLYLAASFGGLILGTINLRMASLRMQGKRFRWRT